MVVRTLTLGTDCSGIDAPLLALKQLASGFGVHCAFASDINPTARKVLKAATPPPEVVYDDLLTRDNTTGPSVDL